MFRIIALVSGMTFISLPQAQSAEPYQGFNLHGQAINPVCIHKMRPWLSDGGIIVRSIVLENCQNSNWGSHGDSITFDNDSVSAIIEGEAFKYRVIGKTTTGLFVLLTTNNYITTYRIEEQIIQPDVLKPQTEKVHILTAIGDSWVPCLSQARVQGNKLIIEKRAFDPDAPRPEQCKDQIETVEAEMRP